MITTKLGQKDIIIKPSEFRLFQELMYGCSGVHLSDKKKTLVCTRLKKRILDLGYSHFREYYKHINNPKHKDELQKCINMLTTNETFFFRHKEQWDFIIKILIPEFKANETGNNIIRIWSAASSSGEEAYSCAIAFYEQFSSCTNWNIMIDATDINLDVLAKAKKGIYAPYAIQKLTKLCLGRYFKKNNNNNFLIRDNIKKMVNFKQHNLLNNLGVFRYNIVFLRNVMIYFDSDSKMRVINQVTKSIKKGGYLFLGGAETLSHCQDHFTQIMPTIYRKN